MKDFSVLSSFLLVSMILPGIVLIGLATVLFPSVRLQLAEMDAFALIIVVVVVSFLVGHIPFSIERPVFDRIWDKWRSGDFIMRQKRIGSWSRVIARADAANVSHKHLDERLAEFIFFFNTSFWVVPIAVWSLLTQHEPAQIAVAVFLLLTAVIALFHTSPTFKSDYMAAIESLETYF